jgi:hypothetical protein
MELDKTENNYAEYKRWDMAEDVGIKRLKRHIPEKMLSSVFVMERKVAVFAEF